MRPMLAPLWLRARKPRPFRHPVARPQLGLERLEDRTVPTGYTWIGGAHVDASTTSGDPNSWENTYNWLNDSTHTNNAGVPGPGDTATFTAAVNFTIPSDPTSYTAPFTTSPTYDRVNGGNLDGFQIKSDWTGHLVISTPLGLGNGSGNSLWNAGAIIVSSGATFTNNTLLTLGNLDNSPHSVSGGGTLINANTIRQSGVGVVSFGNGGGDGTQVVNNGLYDLDGDGSIYSAADAAISATFVNTGTFRKSGGAGGGAESVIDHIKFASSGANAKIEVQQGTLRNESFSSNLGDINISTGASFDPGSSATYSGTYSGSGGGTFLISSGLTLSGDTTFNFAGGGLEWAGGTINLNGHTLTIATNSTLTISNLDTNLHVLDGSGKLINNGTVTQTGPGQLRFSSPGVLNSTTIENNGLYVLAGDSDLYTTTNNFNGGTFTNGGILRKTVGAGGAASSTIDGVLFTNTATGSVEVLQGVLRNNSQSSVDAGQSSDTAGSYTVAPGATFVLTTVGGSRGTRYKGQYNFSGGGTVQIADDNSTSADIHLDGTTTFNAAAGMFQWKLGGIDTAGQTLVVAPNSFLTLNNLGAGHSLYGGGTLQNDGTITQTGDGGGLYIGGGANLLNDGQFTLQGDNGISSQTFDLGTFTNAGRLVKTAGAGGTASSVIDGPTFINTTGSVEVQQGILKNASNVDSSATAGSYVVAPGATFVLNNGAGSGGERFHGSYTFSGGGAVLLDAGDIHLDGPTTFDAPPGMFRWTGGNIDLAGQTLTIHAGNGMTLANDAEVALYGSGTLFNVGTIVQSGAGGMSMAGDATLTNAGTYDIVGDAGISTLSFNGPGTINNTGTFEKTGGTGTSPVLSSNGRFEVGVFNNTGTVRVLSGTLDINLVSQVIPEVFTLRGGAWEVSAPVLGTATLTLNGNFPITTNDATVVLTGQGAIFTNLSGLATNSGTFDLEGGQAFAVGSPIANVDGGRIGVGPQSSLAAPAISNNGSSAISNNGSSIVVAAGGTLTASGAAGLLTSDGASFTNNGSVLLTSDGASLITSDGASFTNNGTVNFPLITSDGAGLITSDGAGFTNSGQITAPAAAISNNGSSFVNTGTLLLTSAGNSLITSDGASLTNSGNITAQALGGNIVSQGGGNIVSQGGGNIVAAGGGNITAQGGSILALSGGSVVSQGGGNIVAAGGGNVVSQGGGNIVAAGGGNVVSQGGGNVVSQGGGNIVAAGGGNLVAAGGGNFSGSGNFNGVVLNLAGIIHGGDSPGILTINGGYSQDSTGTMLVFLDGPTPGTGYSQINVSGDVNLDGILTLDVGFTPTGGTQFTVLTATGGTVTGTFAGLPDGTTVIAGGTTFQVNYTSSSVVLTALPPVLPTSTVAALPAFSPATFTVSWSGDDTGGPGIAFFDVFVSDNGGAFAPFVTHTTQTSAPFTGANGHTYGFYSVATDTAANAQPTPTVVQASTTVDAVAPTSTVAALPAFSPATFTVSWSGSDEAGGSGLARFDVFVSDNGGPFAVLVTHTTATSASFTGVAGHTYGFYSVATDNVGLVQPTPAAAQATTTVPPTASPVPPTVPPPSPPIATPGPVGYMQFAVGSDTGGPSTVTEYNPDGSVANTFDPFPGTTGGTRTAVGDFNGDGTPDVAAGTGPGAVAEVKVLDGKTGAVLFDVFPFDNFTGGVFVAAGDITGDGKADLVITPDLTGGPRVEIYRGGDSTEIANFFGIDDPNFRGGARAAAGDVNDDGFADLVISAGFGGGPRISVYDGAALATSTQTHLLPDFFLFEQALRTGAYVAVGDVNGDGFADIIGGDGPRVVIISGQALLSSGTDAAFAAPVASFFAGDVDNQGGIRVSTKNLDGDTRADLVVGSGSGAGSRLTGYLGTDFSGGGAPEDFGFDAIPGFPGGVFVG